MSEMMKQAILEGPGGPWTIKETPIPHPGAGQLLVKIKRASVCKQTDLNSIRALHPPHDHQCWGQLPHHLRMWDNREDDPLKNFYPRKYLQYDLEPFPTRMGHEISGEIVEVGPETPVEVNMGMFRRRRFTPGMRVCGSPIYGGYGEYIVLDMDSCSILPDNISWDQGSLAEPVGCVLPHVLNTVQPNDYTVILGQGALGSIATMLAKACGAKKVVVADPVASKREFALKHGADIALDPYGKYNDGNFADAVWEATDGQGGNSVLECAGEPDSIPYIMYLAADGGRIGQIGACCVPVTVDWSYFHFRGLSLNKFSIGRAHGHGQAGGVFDAALQFISDGKVKVEDLVTHRYKLDQIGEAFEEAEQNPEMVKAIIEFD